MWTRAPKIRFENCSGRVRPNFFGKIEIFVRILHQNMMFVKGSCGQGRAEKNLGCRRAGPGRENWDPLSIMPIFSMNTNTLQVLMDAAAGVQFCSLDHNFELVKGTMISDSFK